MPTKFGTTPASGLVVISRYINYDRFIRRWGLKPVTTASNKDDAKTLLVAAVQDAIQYADDEVDGGMRGGPYAVPLDFTTVGNVVQPKVENWASVIAFNYLYEGRGWEERLKSSNRMAFLVRQVYGEMSLVRAGVRQITAARKSGAGGGISVVQDPTYQRRCTSPHL